MQVVGDSGSRCFCRQALIILVTPLHRPGSANAVPSVCLYEKLERALRCRPIVQLRPTAGLGSPVPGIWRPVGDRIPPSRSTYAF